MTIKDWRENNGLQLKDGQILKVRALTKSKCCNYDGGECAIMGCKCLNDLYLTSIACYWFADAVLPMDEKLNAEILNQNELGKHVKMFSKTCKECGVKFKSEGKTNQYCPKCSKKLESKRKREYKKRQGIK